MHCCDTGDMPAVRLEHLAVKDGKRINKVIAAVKSVFHGDANILLMYSGGKLRKIKLLDVTVPFTEEE
jgi:hypothetical protein